MRRFLSAFASPRLTLLLVMPPVVAYVVTIIVASEGVVMLSKGFDVLTGGVDIALLLATNRWAGLYAVVLLAHVFARLVATSLREVRTPDPSEADVERILAQSHAYTVVVPAEGWIECACRAMPGSWYVADDSGSRAIFWTGTNPLVRRAWRFALWLVLVGILISMFTRQGTYVRLGDGEASVRPITGEVYRYDWRTSLLGARAVVDGDVLGVVDGSVRPNLNEAGEMVPRGWLTRPVTADVVLGKANAPAKTVAMWPPRVFGGRFVSIVELGVAPYVVVTQDGVPISQQYKKVAIVPGIKDTAIVAPDGVPFRVALTLEPGAPPVPYAAFRARIIEGTSTVVESGTVSPFKDLPVGGYVLSVPHNRWWVGLSIVSDPGLWVCIVAGVLLVVALIARLWAFLEGWQRYEMVVADTEHGERLYIGASASLAARRRAAGRLRVVARAVSREV